MNPPGQRGRRTADPISRRSVLRGAVVALGIAATGATSASAQETVSYRGWFTDAAKGGAVGNYDGTTVDERGSDAVTVEVGSEGNGGPFAFGPPAVRIDPGTTVTFDWVSDTHNTIIDEAPPDTAWEGHQPIENTGFSYEHTFEAEGLYKYYCEPHLAMGMKGAIVVGDVEIVADDGGGGTSGDETAVRWPGGETGAAFMALLLGTAGFAVVIALLPDIGPFASTASRPAGEAGYAVHRLNQFRNSWVFSVIVGWLSFFLALVAIGVLFTALWYLGGGATGFLVGLGVVALVVAWYIVSSSR